MKLTVNEVMDIRIYMYSHVGNLACVDNTVLMPQCVPFLTQLTEVSDLKKYKSG